MLHAVKGRRASVNRPHAGAVDVFGRRRLRKGERCRLISPPGAGTLPGKPGRLLRLARTVVNGVAEVVVILKALVRGESQRRLGLRESRRLLLFEEIPAAAIAAVFRFFNHGRHGSLA